MSEKLEKDKPKSGNQNKHIPKDAQVIMAIMKDMCITDYEPRVINQLLEFIYRYVTSILDDAKVFANHAKKKTVDLDDVRLAVQMQLDKTFTTPPPREVLLEIARSKNINPLPLVKPHCGLRLPPDRYCLSACNYKLKPAIKKTVSKPAPTGTKIQQKPGVQQQGVKRPASVLNVAKPASSSPKPVLKFTSGNKVVAKPAIRVTAGTPPSQQQNVKMEEDDYMSM